MDLSRQEIVSRLHRAGLHEAAEAAEATLPDPVPSDVAAQFCAAQGVTTSIMMDRMGASP